LVTRNVSGSVETGPETAQINPRMRYRMVTVPLPLMFNDLIVPPTSGPSVTVCDDLNVRPTKRPFVILPDTLEVMIFPTFVEELAVNVEVALVFHVIVEVSLSGAELFENVAMLIGAVLSDPLNVPPVTPPPVQPVSGRLMLIV
jgi:hypothetical protein